MIKLNHHLGLLIFRVGLSAMMLVHGIPKINRLFEDTIEFADPFGLGATISLILALLGEVVAPILIIIGFKTRLAAIPALITMIVAAFIIHASDPYGNKEMALLYGLGFLTILIAGPGKYSLDKK